MKKVLIYFANNAEALLLKTSRAGLVQITGNKYFVNIVPTPADMLAKADEYDAAMAAAAAGDRTIIARKKVLKVELASMLRKWGIYVNMISDGDPVILASSGLPMAKSPSPTVLAAANDIIVMQGLNPGTVEISFTRPNGAKSYIYQWAKGPLTNDTKWETKGSGLTSMVISNLEPGVEYWFRVTSIGARGEEAISKEVSQYVMPRSQNRAS